MGLDDVGVISEPEGAVMATGRLIRRRESDSQLLLLGNTSLSGFLNVVITDVRGFPPVHARCVARPHWGVFERDRHFRTFEPCVGEWKVSAVAE